MTNFDKKMTLTLVKNDNLSDNKNSLPISDQLNKKKAKLFSLLENHTTLDGETMEYISYLYYRDPKFSYIIAAYNNKPVNYKFKKDEKVIIPYKIVEVKKDETIFQISERETLQRNYFIKLLMINKKIKVKSGDRLKVPPVRSV